MCELLDVLVNGRGLPTLPIYVSFLYITPTAEDDIVGIAVSCSCVLAPSPRMIILAHLRICTAVNYDSDLLASAACKMTGIKQHPG